MPIIGPLLPLLLTIFAQMALFRLSRTSSRWSRVGSSAFGIALAVRYLIWRFSSAIPDGQNLAQQIWVWIFLAFESAAILSSCLVLFFMSRHRDRSADADARHNSPLLRAPVDILIATYNEPYDILERTIVGARAVRHPDLRVWVLDDGARPWVKQLAEELDAFYVSRVKGKHAKAGNVNNGLAHALKTGRAPEFVLLLDADFVPRLEILERTLGLFEEQNVGIVQTPQHFFNADPVQTNLFCASVWPDEQRFFFNYLMPCKDAWGAAFCCGTSAVFRVAALTACGGMATETVTEDMLTTFRMEEVGYQTIYLNEPLSMGLAPEGLHEYITQRSRWCLGAIQQIYTRWSCFGSAPLSFISRLSFFDGILFWITRSTFQLMLLTAPLVYWVTGTAVIQAETPDLIYYLAPMVAANLMFMSFYARNRIMPLVTDVAALITSFTLVRTVAHALIKPRGHAFRVTAKGISNVAVTVQWRLFLQFAALAWATLAGMIWSLRSNSAFNGTPGYGMKVVWSLVSTATFSIAALAAVEQPRFRKHHRFESGEPAEVHIGPNVFDCIVKDISTGGAMLLRTDGWPEVPGTPVLVMEEGALRLPLEAARTHGISMAVTFGSEGAPRRILIRKIFTGSYSNEVEHVSVVKVLTSVLVNLFG